jgi:uncharacterized membrane protein SpoIIM required for sporulation
MRRLFLVMPFLLGWTEETINQRVSLANSISIPSNYTVDSFMIKISKPVPLYSATLHLVAHFTGLQYWMYYWFATSSVVGIFGIWVVFEVGLVIGIMFETRRIDEYEVGDGIDTSETKDNAGESHQTNELDQTMDNGDASAEEHDRLVPKRDA